MSLAVQERTKVEVYSDEDRIRRAIGRLTRPLYAYRADNTAPFPYHDAHAGEVEKLLQRSGRYGPDFAAKFQHDLSPLAYGTLFMRDDPDSFPNRNTLRLIAKARILILESVLVEYGLVTTPVDVGIMMGELARLQSIHWNLPPLDTTIQFVNLIPPRRFVTETDESGLFRIALNAERNSRRHMNRADGVVSTSYRTEGGRHIIDITDNGVGLGEFFERIDFVPEGDEIRISEIVRKAEEKELEEKDALDKRGKRHLGFKIMNYFGKEIGAEVVATHPKLVEGTQISIKLRPAA